MSTIPQFLIISSSLTSSPLKYSCSLCFFMKISNSERFLNTVSWSSASIRKYRFKTIPSTIFRMYKSPLRHSYDLTSKKIKSRNINTNGSFLRRVLLGNPFSLIRSYVSLIVGISSESTRSRLIKFCL